MSRKQYKCKVNGVLGPNCLCGSVGVGKNSDRCMAHGNTKCRHKVEIEEKEQDSEKRNPA